MFTTDYSGRGAPESPDGPGGLDSEIFVSQSNRTFAEAYNHLYPNKALSINYWDLSLILNGEWVAYVYSHVQTYVHSDDEGFNNHVNQEIRIACGRVTVRLAISLILSEYMRVKRFNVLPARIVTNMFHVACRDQREQMRAGLPEWLKTTQQVMDCIEMFDYPNSSDEEDTDEDEEEKIEKEIEEKIEKTEKEIEEEIEEETKEEIEDKIEKKSRDREVVRGET